MKLALKAGVVVGVSQVASGLACRCLCPSCGEPLVAKKGGLVQHHFAHQSGTECPGAHETALHLAAKQAIARRRELLLPAVLASFQTSRPPLEVESAERAIFDTVALEVAAAGMIFDALCERPVSPLIVEIRVTHAVDAAKRAKLRELGRAAIEVNLSGLPHDLDIPRIERLVVDSVERKEWLSYPGSPAALADARRIGRRLAIQRRSGSRHVDWCPLEHWHFKGRPYANVSIHCKQCPHALEISYAKEEVVCAAERPGISQLPLFSGDA